MPFLQLIILDAHSRKKAEEAEFRAALAAALAERHEEGRALVAVYNSVHKHVMRAGTQDPAATEEQVGAPYMYCMHVRLCMCLYKYTCWIRRPSQDLQPTARARMCAVHECKMTRLDNTRAESNVPQACVQLMYNAHVLMLTVVCINVCACARRCCQPR